MNELNGTEQEQRQNNQLQMMVNMNIDPASGNVIVTATVGIISSTIVIPSNLYDEFNTKHYLPAKRSRIKLLTPDTVTHENIRRSRND